jgi:hypothetical protein
LTKTSENFQISYQQNKTQPVKLEKIKLLPEEGYKVEIAWRNVLIFIFLHYCAIRALALDVKSSTIWIGLKMTIRIYEAF